MVVVPLVSLVKVDDTVPGVSVEMSAGAREGADDDRLDGVDRLDRRELDSAASRSRDGFVAPDDAEVAGAVDTTTTAPPTTVAPPTTAAPTTTAAPPTTVRAATAPTAPKPTTTTAPKPSTTTTVKPTTTTAPPATTTTTTAAPRMQEGDASYYAAREASECAHRTLPFGTVLTVTNLDNGRRTTCRVNDRGPYIEGRVVDLSEYTFSQLAPVSEGVIRVRIEW